MAELGLQDKLQPSLLDRLADDEPDKLTEARDQRTISLAKLRSCILRDLSWLLNAVHLSATEDLSSYPAVERSVLNFGLPGYAGRSVGEIEPSQIERAIREAVLRYEPRLLANSLKLSLVRRSLREDSHNVIAIEIEGQLWAQPLPFHMFMKTELDLELGSVRITEETEAEVESRRADERRR
jgi:type VI secretion system protein ImpF